MLTGKWKELRIHDEFVNLTRLVGCNRAHVEQHLPHRAKLLLAAAADLDGVKCSCSATPPPRERVQAWLNNGRQIFDLTGMKQPPDHPHFQQVN